MSEISTKPTTAWAEVDENGRLILPPEVAQRYGLNPGSKVRLDEGQNFVRMHRPVTHLTNVYIEPTTGCNLHCRSCIRNVWQDAEMQMSMSTFERIMDSLQGLGDVKRVVFTRYHASFTNFPPSFGKPWQVVVVVPEDDFIGAVKNQTRHVFYISLFFLALSWILAFLISRRISQPILQLAKETDNIRNFQLDAPLNIKSHIAEIQVLGEAIDRTKVSLRSFMRFAPHQLVQQVILDGKELILEGERREVTLLFSDLRNFTHFAEQTRPEEVVHILNVHFDSKVKIISDHGGYVVDFLGDCLFAVFGAPQRCGRSGTPTSSPRRPRPWSSRSAPARCGRARPAPPGAAASGPSAVRSRIASRWSIRSVSPWTRITPWTPRAAAFSRRSVGAPQKPTTPGRSLFSAKDLLASVSRGQVAYGIYSGCVLMLLVWAALVFIAVRDRAFLAYFAYVATFGLYMLVNNGLAFQFLWPASPRWGNASVIVMLSLALLSALQFSRMLLHARNYTPGMDPVPM